MAYFFQNKKRDPIKGPVILPHTFGQERIILFVLEVSGLFVWLCEIIHKHYGKCIASVVSCINICMYMYIYNVHVHKAQV